MEKAKNLYPDTPPTILRNREEKLRTAKNIPFWHFVASFIFMRMLKRRFFSMMIKGEENLEKRDKRFATIYYAPHTNWWDGMLGYIFVNHMPQVKGKFRLMIEEMNRFPLFQYIGCFPVNKKTAQSAMQSLKYCSDFFKDPSVNFWIFPQGIIRPPHHRPIKFQSGLTYLAQQSIKNFGGINLVPVAVKYTFLREDKPEILMQLGGTITLTNPDFDRKEFTKKIEGEFEILCDNQDKEVATGCLDNYWYFYKQKLAWWKRIEKKLKNIGMTIENRTSTI